MAPLTISEREELEQLRGFASKVMMNPFQRAFFDLQRIIDSYPESNAIRVLATAIAELKRELMQ